MDSNQETVPASGLGGYGNMNPTVYHNSHGTVNLYVTPILSCGIGVSTVVILSH